MVAAHPRTLPRHEETGIAVVLLVAGELAARVAKHRVARRRLLLHRGGEAAIVQLKHRGVVESRLPVRHTGNVGRDESTTVIRRAWGSSSRNG